MRNEKCFLYLRTHSTHFIYGYMASDIWLRTILIVRKETRCRHIGYSYRLTARVLLYAPSHRQDNTYHGLCYTSRGALAGVFLRFFYFLLGHENESYRFASTTCMPWKVPLKIFIIYFFFIIYLHTKRHLMITTQIQVPNHQQVMSTSSFALKLPSPSYIL